MKKLSFSVCLLVLLLPALVLAEFGEGASMADNNIPIMSGQTIAASGTCTFIIDLRNPAYYPITEGDFSLQFAGVTSAWVTSAGAVSPMGGATINAAYRMSNRMPSGTVGIGTGLLTGTSVITSNLESINIVTDLPIDTGDTEYVSSFWPVKKFRYLIIDITSGVTPTISDDIWIELN